MGWAWLTLALAALPAVFGAVNLLLLPRLRAPAGAARAAWSPS